MNVHIKDKKIIFPQGSKNSNAESSIKHVCTSTPALFNKIFIFVYMRRNVAYSVKTLNDPNYI